MKALSVCAFLLLTAAPVVAQTHPCDVAVVQNPNLTSPVKVGFCHTLKDQDGNAVVVTAFKVFLDAAPLPSFDAALTPIGGANAAGLFYFESPSIVVPKGSHAFFVSAAMADGSESARSASIPFDVISAPVVAPTNGRVKK